MNQKMPDWIGKKRVYNEEWKDVNENVIRWDVIKIENKKTIKVRFISTNSKNLQGIFIGFCTKKGKIKIKEVQAKQFDLWEDSHVKEYKIECDPNGGDEEYLSVYNIFLDAGDKKEYSQTRYGGMLLEKKGNIYRYSCNDEAKNTKFDELVFEIEFCD